jgi:hypothetical protein
MENFDQRVQNWFDKKYRKAIHHNGMLFTGLAHEVWPFIECRALTIAGLVAHRTTTAEKWWKMIYKFGRTEELGQAIMYALNQEIDL